MYLLAVRSVFRKGNVSSVKDINEQISTEGNVFYNSVKISLISTITSHHKPNNSHSAIPESFKYQIFSADIFGKIKKTENPTVLLERKDINP